MMQHHPNQNSCLSDSILSLPMNLICGCVWKQPPNQSWIYRTSSQGLNNDHLVMESRKTNHPVPFNWNNKINQHNTSDFYLNTSNNVVLTRENSTSLSSKGEQVHGTRTIDHKLVKASAIDVKDQSIHLRYWASPFEVVCICLRLHHTNAKAHISWSRFNTN